MPPVRQFLFGLLIGLVSGLAAYGLLNQLGNPCRFRTLGALAMPLLTGIGGIFISTQYLKNRQRASFGMGVFSASIPLLVLGLLVIAQLRSTCVIEQPQPNMRDRTL